jgi:tripartite-type tricarboxylate transporter receptor subunit TctC
MKNRKREICTSGSVRDEAGQPPHLLGRRQFLHLAAGAAALMILVGLAGEGARSQAARTIKLIVPFPPGGGFDVLSRLLGQQISKAHGPTVLVENRAGAGGSLAYEAAARAAPDGNTLVIIGNSIVINPILRKVNYGPLTSFQPICYLVRVPQVIAVNSSSPYRALNDLIIAARAKSGELSLASAGPATTQHLGVEQFRRLANINVTYVAYPGGAPAFNALLGGHVTAVLGAYSEAVEQLNTGKLRALAAMSLKRIEPLPDVPTVAEVLGDKEFEAEVWSGVVAPAKTPKEVIDQLANWFSIAMQADEVHPKLLNLGLYPVEICGEDFAAHIRRQRDQYSLIIRDANIKPE